MEGSVRDEELSTMRARLLLNLGLVREAQKAPDEALEKLELAAALCREHNLVEDLHRSNIALGTFHERQLNYDLALEFYEKSANVINTTMKADSYLAKAELLLKLGEWLEARKPLVKLYIMKNLSEETREYAERLFRIGGLFFIVFYLTKNHKIVNKLFNTKYLEVSLCGIENL